MKIQENNFMTSEQGKKENWKISSREGKYWDNTDI